MSFRDSETIFDDDPCIKEYLLTKKCMGEKGHEHCQDVLRNYEHCRYFWSWIESMRDQEGIKPAMPPPEEREEVKQRYLPLLKPPSPRLP
ncbi:unnamed protein product [Candidula unifasciata]|uniref:Coiled-coil-helix-coiled-coil-helix domain-containing protein 7 n=1 Tax=Candidula unifasciata TaxID=100452 RepID=A0A8S3YEA5_9EUPU|nr:unnamed protein product [Candidula unifasciata]